MRLGTVIGKATLSQKDPALTGGRFLLVQPLDRDRFEGRELERVAPGNTVVVYDALGAGRGQIVGFVEGAEATAPFSDPTPVDAYNVLLVDRLFYFPPN